ncbi:MAG TPA: hypothetical protein VN673_01500 [Clostridia bacterium]|nr:hypothetical protein [Clostridia bacterium]
MDANQLAEQTRQKAQEGLHTAQEWTEKAKGTTRNVRAAADLYLHEYAWTSVALIAATAGILGYLLGARRR